MLAYRTALLLAALACLGVVTPGRAADEKKTAEVPSFKKRDENEKVFMAKVGEAAVRAVRTSPAKLEMDSYKITDPKANRKVITIKMNWAGSVTGKKFTSDVTLTVDPTEKDKWEVLDIDYKDDNPTPKLGLETNLKKLKAEFNR